MSLDKETLQEIGNVVNEASQGNWIPISIVSGLLTAVVLLIIIILRMKEKGFNIRLNKSDLDMEIIKKQSIRMGQIIAVHDVEIENLKEAS
jgi:ABC-type anion transport system duplicated permease subunit